ncbi:hypothetical protein A2671_01490 [Candidatus Kaiserbacteria bacterium RIFCSPHIGHO2_01_FULL_49_13]|uniref:Small ribosomal subunit protein bS6 n=1 Tax=Candidatus Kaiserbacteria bacterium RIFCSPHIGHO2_01_FULL_49_13 TaxID=1798477 RepID=A0A1F6CEB7_9BACT|nr:MAG: hypothetical protein A2671_01490 [Candidatus Kaiserbacteria bacterium RIFCSPHIGHO2_01_FULL_49_13]
MAERKEKTAETEDREAKVYELGYLLVPTLEEEKIAGEAGVLKEVLQKAGGVFVAEEFPKKIPLAYAMAKEVGGKRAWHTNAYFGWMKYELSPAAAAELANDLKENESLLRFLLIQTVRESTMAPKRPLYVKMEPPARTEGKTGVRKAAKPAGPAMTEEELDRTIEELVIE